MIDTKQTGIGWLIHNRFPEGFRVLCFNCNNSLGMHGYCPHGNLIEEPKKKQKFRW